MPLLFNRARQTLSRRTVLLGGLMSLPLPLLLGRLYYLQQVSGQVYRQMAENNRVNVRPLRPERGRLLDRFGQVIAQDKPAYRLVLIPEECPNPQEILKRLSSLIPLKEKAQNSILDSIRKRAPFTPVTVMRSLSFEEIAKVQVNLPDLPGVDLAMVPLRAYQEAEMVSHLTGYMGRPDYYASTAASSKGWSPDFPVGREGLEKTLEEKVRGVPGLKELEVTARGRPITELGRTPPVKGTDIRLSLDMVVQKEAWKQLEGHTGCIVALDIASGGILASASRPGFDPNVFSEGIDEETWQGIVNDDRNPLLNRCFQGVYSPGSTFKPLVALAALSEGVAKPEEIIRCTGKIKYGDRDFHCWKKHGRLNLSQAITQSCDIYFYELADRLGVDTIARYAEMFGLGQTYGLGLPEKEGLIPTKKWKRSRYGEPWNNGETLNIGIGQGFMLTTPLQLALMSARLASGQAIVPTLLKSEEKTFSENLPIEGEHMNLVRESMYNVLHGAGGTARGAAKPLFKAGGKTGTVQVISQRIEDDVDMSDVPYKRRPHGVFVAFGPYYKPRVAVCALVEHGGSGSGSAARPAMAVLERALTSLRVV